MYVCVCVCVLQESGPNLSFEEAGRKCRKLVSRAEDFTSIQLVYGNAGDGKTHYIRQQLVQSPAKLTIAVNEAFSPLSAIKKLRSLPSNVKDCAIFFNFATMSYQVRRWHCVHISTAYTVVQWCMLYITILYSCMNSGTVVFYAWLLIEPCHQSLCICIAWITLTYTVWTHVELHVTSID